MLPECYQMGPASWVRTKSNSTKINYVCFSKSRRMENTIVFHTIITCPNCGYTKEETMCANACQFFYQCENCKAIIRPKPGECCVYCSYGTVKCPPVQMGLSC